MPRRHRPASTPSPVAEPGRGRGWREASACAATVVCLVPVLVATARVVGRDLVLLPDTSVIDLHVRDVLGGDVPLVGPYSRFLWNHPGPILYYVLAPLHALGGGAPWTTLAGDALLHGVVIVCIALLAWRRGGLTLVLLALAAVMLADAAIGTRLLLDAWNPNLPVPLLVLYVLCIWSVALGDRWQLVSATVVGTFLAQTHVGYAPLVVAGGIWAIAVAVHDGRRRPGGLRTLGVPSLVAGACAIALWIPPAVEQLTGDPGNLTLIQRYVTESRGRRLGLVDALGVLAAEFRVVPPWIAPDATHDDVTALAPVAAGAWLLVAGALVALGIVAARRARSRGASRLIAVVTLLGVVGVAAASRVELPRFTYLFDWRVPLATLLLVAVAWALASALGRAVVTRPELRALRVAAAGMVIAGVAWVAIGYALDVAEAPLAEAALASTTRRFAPRLERAADDDVILMRDASTKLSGLFDGLVDRLDRAGVDVRVDPQLGFVYGDARTVPRGKADSVWHVSDEGITTSILSGQEDAAVLAATSPLSRADEEELRDLQRRLTVELTNAGRADLVPLLDDGAGLDEAARVSGVDARAARRAHALVRAVERSGRCRCAVVAFDPDSPFVR